MPSHLASVKLVLILIGLALAIISTPAGAITIIAKYLSNDQIIECPPGCMEIEGTVVPDSIGPISFRVCDQNNNCFQLVSGSTAEILENSNVKAPDGISPGEQLPNMEEDVYLQFRRWGDGTTDNPRLIGPTTGPADLVAYYDFGGPSTVGMKANARGCGDRLFILLGSSVSWAPVSDEPEYQTILGPVTEFHVSPKDLYSNHKTNDVNAWIKLSARQRVELLSVKNGQRGDRPDQIEVEWEQGSYPTWAWASREASIHDEEEEVPETNDADLAWVKGSWIFDCGHPDSDIDQGAWTEIHPPIATAVMRGTRQGKFFLKDDVSEYFPNLHEGAVGIEGVQVDLWINGDGGDAVKSIKCAKILSEGSGCIFTPVFDVAGIYEFDVPLPPSPSPIGPGAQFRIEFLRLQPDQPKPKVTRVVVDGREQLHVKLDLTNYDDVWRTCLKQNELYGEHLVNCSGEAYGVTIIAGWEVFQYPPELHRIRVSFNSVQIFADREGEPIGDGEYKLWLDLGPGGVLAGDPTKKSVNIPLHDRNKALNDVEGNGESYSLIKDGSPLLLFFNVISNRPESDHLRIRLYGYEDDPISDDKLGEILRIFYNVYSVWEPSGFKPSWAPPTYGIETEFGTVRAGTEPGIVPYSDPANGSCAVPCINHWLDYTVEEISLP